MEICVIGTGYVGLVAGTCFAEMGNNVICVDKDETKTKNLQNGTIHIYEPGLEELVKSNIAENRLSFSSDLDSAVKKSEVCFIAVGTPQNNDGSADLQYVFEAAEDIAEAMNGYKVVVNKSTVPVGTAEKISEIIKLHTSYPFDVVSNPEFLKQGNAVEDFLRPDRVIIGSDSEKSTKIMREIYAPFFRTVNRLIIMDIKSAEMTKYAANAFLATKISFMNEMANLCEKVGADVEMVRIGISSDARIGNKFLFAGLGYGGSCFPKDVKALIKTGEKFGCDMFIIKSVDSTNEKQREVFIEKITNRFGANLCGKTFGVLGLAYKPRTSDMRESPSVTVINALLNAGAKVKCYDPKAVISAKNIFKDKVLYCKSSYEALENSDAMLLMTEWNEFRHPDFARIKKLLKQPIIFDGRNIYAPDLLKEYGFEYYPVGRNV